MFRTPHFSQNQSPGRGIGTDSVPKKRCRKENRVVQCLSSFPPGCVQRATTALASCRFSASGSGDSGGAMCGASNRASASLIIGSNRLVRWRSFANGFRGTIGWMWSAISLKGIAKPCPRCSSDAQCTSTIAPFSAAMRADSFIFVASASNALMSSAGGRKVAKFKTACGPNVRTASPAPNKPLRARCPACSRDPNPPMDAPRKSLCS
mmetsp:Transcript_67724/g.107275  ORF Transcript_67724/g.107275 Transcript_67724/m.107275 type:complete len:208 (-) Transcript_67724:1937-2560(-)